MATDTHCADPGAIACVKFAKQMDAEVNGDGVRADALERNDLPGEGSSDLARPMAPVDSSMRVSAFEFVMGRVSPALQLYLTRTRPIEGSRRMHPKCPVRSVVVVPDAPPVETTLLGRTGGRRRLCRLFLQ